MRTTRISAFMMTINIPKNDYVTPTECRQEVVQAICDAFLSEAQAWSSFYPYSANRYRLSTLLVVSKNGKFYGFRSETADDVFYRIRGCEMKAAFECLVQAGYHIFRYYAFHDTQYPAYCVRKEPFMQNAKEVFSFEDRID